MTTEISITRALKEVSVLDKRIVSAVKKLTVLDVTQGKFKGKALKTNQSVEEFSSTVKSNYDSLNDLVERRNNIKKCIVLSNAKTSLNIGGSEYTVAEAIEKKTSIGFKKNILAELVHQKRMIDIELEQSRTSLNSNLDRFMEQNLGKDRKTNKDDFDNIAQPYIEANEMRAIDPIGIAKEIESLENEIELFESDVDIALSESNAKTLITV